MRHANNEKLPVTEETTARATDDWLKSVYITPKFLAKTEIATEFLQAQSEAETLLRKFPKYLTKSQSYQLVRFLKRLRNRKQRESMPISAAYAVLNISVKINRQLFAEYRKQGKTTQDKPLANKG